MAASGEHAKPIRAVLRRLGPDRRAFEVFKQYLDGRDLKVPEIRYDRVK